jgi:farnesyl-diphosphate farnesyltransferase
MPNLSTPLSLDEITYQQQALSEVSRTFALTIPLLPTQLEHAVGNAYLLCRIADTIEDDPLLAVESKLTFSQQLIDLINGSDDGQDFATELAAALSPTVPTTEVNLVKSSTRVIAITRKLSPLQQRAIQTCVTKMATGMPDFQGCEQGAGLADMATLNRYCYVVAGVVGEMLTDLFCAHSAAINNHRDTLSKLAHSFGQGLQLTNILKDVQVDKSRGICWLPRDIFGKNGFDLSQLESDPANPGMTAGIEQLLGMTRYHLNNAVRYALLIPVEEREIRRFLLFPVILALLTLKKLQRRQENYSDQSIKISRRAVTLSGIFIKTAATRNRAVLTVVNRISRGLPGPLLGSV